MAISGNVPYFQTNPFMQMACIVDFVVALQNVRLRISVDNQPIFRIHRSCELLALSASRCSNVVVQYIYTYNYIYILGYFFTIYIFLWLFLSLSCPESCEFEGGRAIPSQDKDCWRLCMSRAKTIPVNESYWKFRVWTLDVTQLPAATCIHSGMLLHCAVQLGQLVRRWVGKVSLGTDQSLTFHGIRQPPGQIER